MQGKRSVLSLSLRVASASFRGLILTLDDVSSFIHLLVLAAACHISEGQHDNKALRDRFIAVVRDVMAQRVSDVAAIVGADTFLLTAAIKLVVTTLPNSLRWSAMGESEYCFEAGRSRE